MGRSDQLIRDPVSHPLRGPSGDRVSIPESYERSRERFCENIAAVRNLWPAARLDKYSLAGAPELSIDWIAAEACHNRQRLFILTTGLHGIEGDVGSAMMQLFIEEFQARFDPDTTGILLVHAINPWGMKHHRCVTADNIDLNRNFVRDFDSLANFNPDYSRLDPFLNPQQPIRNVLVSKFAFLLCLPGLLARFGVRRFREAALMGQYRLEKGLYFGGNALHEESQVMGSLYRKWISGYDQILHLDMHTGYGPRNQMTLINSAREGMSSGETANRYGVRRVVAPNPDEFYTVSGDMTDFVYDLVKEEFPDGKVYSATFEFGTFGDSLLAGIRSLRAVVFENRLYEYGGNQPAQKWVKREFDELYVPSDPEWFEKAKADARQAFEGILGVEGYLP